MTLKDLGKINNRTVKSAGPRYSPIIDPAAPNLEIEPLISAIEALALSNKYKDSLIEIRDAISQAWLSASKSTKKAFKIRHPSRLVSEINLLLLEKPGKGFSHLAVINKLAKNTSDILQAENEKLWEQERQTKEHSDEWRAIQSELSSIRKIETAIRKVHLFARSPNFSLVFKNRMLLLGEWGTGKTHLLCDVTLERMKRNLPTLFFLAHQLPTHTDPLTAICKVTGLASTPKKLLEHLNKIGKKSNTRALLVIDGINEAERKAWKTHIPGIIKLVEVYPYVGLILSCRTPFDKQIISEASKKKFVSVFHTGFQEIEFDAQRTFFSYYKIPNPYVPLLTPEFSRPLFLKILCLTFSGQTATTKSQWINEIASGQRTMTKLFEDFICYSGSKIESDFSLAPKICWRIMKGQTLSSGELSGVAVSMARQVKDFLEPQEVIDIVQKITGMSKAKSLEIYHRLIGEGLLVEDINWKDGASKEIIRLPYQRFSDHLIARHLLKEFLDSTSEAAIRRSFIKTRPLGKIFDLPEFGYSYKMPGLASAIMLEFPERVKKTLPASDRELVYYLPKKRRFLTPLVDTFLEGVLWRNKDSFTAQTGNVFGLLLSQENSNILSKTFDVLVTLACRSGHPYSSTKLYNYLAKMTVAERDLLWSEFLRRSHSESVIYRLLNWIEDKSREPIESGSAGNLIQLLALFLTTTDRSLKDRTTKALVILGEEQPEALFEKTIVALSFNDPYVLERMLAASYGILMRGWSFPSNPLIESSIKFAQRLYDSLFAIKAMYATTHILARDYALGSIELCRQINKNCLKGRTISRLKAPYAKSAIAIPKAGKITEKYAAQADPAIHMDFDNYTMGRLVSDRRNYDSAHCGYKAVKRRIKWRILNLGYSSELFKDADSSIVQNDSYYSQKRDGSKVDRYGKKYSWIGFFEVAGILHDEKVLPDRHTSRISDADIDPSFPEKLRTWKPKPNKFFKNRFISARHWAANGEIPNYDHLLQIDEVDKINGPWVLLGGYLSESAKKDARKVFTFINGVLVKNKAIQKLRRKFSQKEYPGNREIPEPWEDHYTFAGEVPWSSKYGFDFHHGKKNKRHVGSCFEEHKTFTIKKKTADLTKSEKFKVAIQTMRIEFGSPGELIPVVKEAEEKIKTLPKYTEIFEYKTIPGIPVEVPRHTLSWESHHSTENQSGYADFIAPALCDFLKLRNKGSSQDLFDENGNPASLYRMFGDGSDYYRSNLLYIRRDLLESYLRQTGQKLVWFIWGERDFKHEVLQEMRTEIQDIWSAHKHIHKRMKIAKLSTR